MLFDVFPFTGSPVADPAVRNLKIRKVPATKALETAQSPLLSDRSAPTSKAAGSKPDRKATENTARKKASVAKFVSNVCPICVCAENLAGTALTETALKAHVESHLPWFFSREDSCWECCRSFASGIVLGHHMEKEHVNVCEGRFNQEKHGPLWARAMGRLLDLITEKYGFSNWQQLLNFVVDHSNLWCVPAEEKFNGDWKTDILGVFTIPQVTSVLFAPPNTVTALFHWKMLMILVSCLTPEVQQDIYHFPLIEGDESTKRKEKPPGEEPVKQTGETAQCDDSELPGIDRRPFGSRSATEASCSEDAPRERSRSEIESKAKRYLQDFMDSEIDEEKENSRRLAELELVLSVDEQVTQHKICPIFQQFVCVSK